MKKSPTTVRAQLLSEVAELTEGARNKTHGDPVAQLACCAALWNTYLTSVFERRKCLTATDVAMMIDLMKTSRYLNGNRYEKDHYVDKAGYSAIAWECAIADAAKDLDK